MKRARPPNALFAAIRRLIRRAPVLICWATLGVTVGYAQETIDEVYALVDRTPILKSDLELFHLVGLVSDSAEGETPERFLARALDLRIRLELQYLDLVASGSIHRLSLDVEEAIDALVTRGGGLAAVEAALTKAGLGWEDLEALALRTAATRAWVDQHLRPRITVSIEDVETAYREMIVEPYSQRGEEPPPLVRVKDELHAVVVEASLNQEIERWVAQARERLEVLRFHS